MRYVTNTVGLLYRFTKTACAVVLGHKMLPGQKSRWWGTNFRWNR